MRPNALRETNFNLSEDKGKLPNIFKTILTKKKPSLVLES